MKIVFANILMEISHKAGTDVDVITDALKLGSNRIISGKYFGGGMGDGGSCHPRDNIALSWLARKLDLSYDWFDSLMMAREKQTEWLADLMEEHELPKIILGTSYKPESNLQAGSPALLLKNILEKRGHVVYTYDPYVHEQIPEEMKNPGVFMIGTKHPDFKNFAFPEGSVVIDPWRYLPDKKNVNVIRLGSNQSKV